MLHFFKTIKPDGRRVEVSYDEALRSLLGTYRDNDMTRDMLTIPNRIDCRYSVISVVDGEGVSSRGIMAGLYNLLPMGAEYDDNGSRL